jgi:hypothetical protein
MDQFVPNWVKKTAKDAIEMDDTSMCLLGQNFGDFSDGARELAEIAIKKTLSGTGLRLAGTSLDYVRIDDVHYGFDIKLPGDVHTQAYSVLGEAWQAEIAAREATAKRSRAARKGVATRRANSRSGRRNQDR